MAQKWIERHHEIEPSSKGQKPMLPSSRDATESEAELLQLRQFFHGNPDVAAEHPAETDLPALLNDFRELRRFRYDYPLLLNPPGNEPMVQTLESFLKDAITATAPTENQAKILKDNVAWLDRHLREELTESREPQPAATLLKSAISALITHLKLQPDSQSTLEQDCQQLLEQLHEKANLMAYSPDAYLYLFTHLADSDRHLKRQQLAENIQDHIVQLQAMLKLADTATQPQQSATGLISNDALNQVLKKKSPGTVSLTAQRRQRLETALATLKDFDLDGQSAVQLFARNNISDISNHRFCAVTHSESPLADASQAFRTVSTSWSTLFCHLHIAELEIHNEYDEDVHNSWFSQFDWEALREDELGCLPIIAVIEATHHLVNAEMPVLSRLLTSGIPIQIFMTVSAHGNPEALSDDPVHDLRMELAGFGMSHRNVIVNQLSGARHQSLISGYQACLDNHVPAMHLIHTGYTTPQPLHPWLLAGAALESRAHPCIRYSPHTDGHLDFTDNPTPEADWCEGEFEYQDEDGSVSSLTLPFTFADYCLLKPDLHQHFCRIPDGLQSDDLVSVADYLASSPEKNRSQIPLVWAVSGTHGVLRFVISRVMLFACRDRLSFWHDLQSMAGIHNFYVESAVEKTRAEEQAVAAEEIRQISSDFEAKLIALQEGATSDIMTRLTQVLMGLDLSDAALLSPGQPSVDLASLPSTEPTPEAAADSSADSAVATTTEQPEEEASLSFDEPWIESMLCTSCDDCMSINKLMFAYNEDKQATIKNPTAGSYEQLVKAAELCPAKCIHPGKPLDTSEPGLEALIKRAEPFNS